MWAEAHNAKLDKFEAQRAMIWVYSTYLLCNCMPVSLTMTKKYTGRTNGTVKKCKSKCPIRGDPMRLIVHYYPNHATRKRCAPSTPLPKSARCP